LFQYFTTIFLSAFLLFQVQPLMGKFLLPWFGGGPAVWTTCMLFFQPLLLGGYAYAHLIATRVTSAGGGAIHLVVLTGSVLLLPITPSEASIPAEPSMPAGRLLTVLISSVGIPYFALASTGPLLQRWFHQRHPTRSPFRLYALSNAGSLLGLVMYPLVVERWIGLNAQTVAWSAGYLAFAALCGSCAWAARASSRPVEPGAPTGAEAATSADTERGDGGGFLLWISLSAIGSLLMLSTTNQMSQAIPPVPLLWVLPLALYLASFIICFDNDRWYDRRVWCSLFLASLAPTLFVLIEGLWFPVPIRVTVYAATLFFGCMVCHGELARSRPEPGQLTSFYLSQSLGGAIGGIFATFVAPALFLDYWEFHLSLAAAYTLAAARIGGEFAGERRLLFRAGSVAVGVLLSIALGAQIYREHHDTIAMSRNFYGVLAVQEQNAENDRWIRSLLHGRVEHGSQQMDAEHRRRAQAFYADGSGIAIAIEALRESKEGRPGAHSLRIGVLGLGAGAIAAHGRRGDSIRFYEIDLHVEEMARRYFTYLEDTPAKVDVVLGDARLSIAREFEHPALDLLVLDAFNGDSIPVHLVTLEAAQTYFGRLAPRGVLAIHSSSYHVDVAPLARGLANALDKEMIGFFQASDREKGIEENRWVLLTSDPELHDTLASQPHAEREPGANTDAILWTDDFSDPLRIIR